MSTATSPAAPRKSVLIVAFHYPPQAGSSGIQRTLKFSAYLRDFGWEPIVLTVNPRAYEQVSDGQLADIPAGMVVERAFALDAARHFSLAGRYPNVLAMPDQWASWWPMGVWAGLRLIRQHRPAVIMSTYPIATAHMIAKTLARRSGLPWVADFRDNMIDAEFPREPARRRFNSRLEEQTVRNCARALFTTPGALAMYAERYPDLPASRWTVIENGFDEENFAQAEQALPAFTATSPSAPLRLLHSGVLYPEERDPRPFFAAVRRLKLDGKLHADQLQIVLRATGTDGLYGPMLREAGIDDIVQLAPPVPYRAALQEMLTADGLLLFQAAMCNHQIPAKLYEYMRAGRPIFALTDERGDTAAVMRAAGTGTLCDITDEADITARLAEFVARLQAGAASGTDPAVAARHSRRARSAELARLLDGVLA